MCSRDRCVFHSLAPQPAAATDALAATTTGAATDARRSTLPVPSVLHVTLREHTLAGTPVRSTPLVPAKGTTTMLALPLANVVDPAVLNKAATITRWVMAGPVLYALMSVNEYFTHRYGATR